MSSYQWFLFQLAYHLFLLFCYCAMSLTLISLSQGSNLWKDRDSFKKFAQASLELCKVYIDISSSTGSRRELLTAEMHLKNILKQASSFILLCILNCIVAAFIFSIFFSLVCTLNIFTNVFLHLLIVTLFCNFICI